MIKLIAMDMDGTLLKSDNTIDSNTKALLLHLEEQGVKLVLASGRSYMKLMKYAKELKMDVYGGYLIEVNGLALNDVQNEKRLVKTQLSFEDVKDIYTFAKPFEIEMQALFDDGMFIHIPKKHMEEKRLYREQHRLPEDYPWTRGALSYMHDNREGYPKQVYIQNIEEACGTLNKVCYVGEEAEIDVFSARLKQHFKDRFWIGKTTKTWLEIMPSGITKGAALLDLADQLGIQKEEILAFGDGENDIEMLQAIPYGIAMANALPTVKKVAWAVTDDHNHEGIAKILKKYLNGAFPA